MNIYKDFLLKKVEHFQSLSPEEQERSIKIHKHKYLAIWLAATFTTRLWPILLVMAVAVVNLLFLFFVDGIFTIIFLHITMPLILPVFAVEIYVFYLTAIKKKEYYEVNEKLFDFFTNLWLYNYKVISRKDWKRIKKFSMSAYNSLRCEKVNHKCYHTCFSLMQFLHNNELKMAWIYLETWCSKCGHAVLIKGDYVYDSNMRRTYSKDEYFTNLNVRIFKEFTFVEYEDFDELLESKLWDEFGIWCENFGGKRDTDSEQG